MCSVDFLKGRGKNLRYKCGCHCLREKLFEVIIEQKREMLTFSEFHRFYWDLVSVELMRY